VFTLFAMLTNIKSIFWLVDRLYRLHGPWTRVRCSLYPCSRAVFTARGHGWKKRNRVHGPRTRVVNTAR